MRRKTLGEAMPAVAPMQRLLNAKQLAGLVGCTPRTIRRLVEQNKIPSIKIGGLIRFDYGDVLPTLKGNGK